MRIALIALAVSCISFGYTAQANQKHSTVEGLEAALSQAKIKYDSFITSSATINNEISIEQKKLEQAKILEQQLIKQKEKALADMNSQYKLMINDPTQDITLSQNEYRYLTQKQNENSKSQAAATSALKKLNGQLAEKNITQFKFVNEIETLNEEIKVIRIQRLRDEFTKTGTVEINQSINCNIKQSFSQCMERGALLSKQKASQAFFDQLFNDATEAKLINQNKISSKAHVKLLSYKVVTDEFTGKVNYNSTIQVKIKGLLPKNEACELLSIPSRYCYYDTNQASIINNQNKKQDNEDATLYELTVRSNLYDDEVFVDGVSYGSSKVSIMLSPGIHNIVVKKANFNTYDNEIKLTRNTVIRAKLDKSSFNTEIGQEGQDTLSTGELGPKLIGIPSGELGLAKKQALGVSNIKFDHQAIAGFSISRNPITVGDFNKFVTATNYITDAESGNGCAELIDGVENFNLELNWRQPGFSQTDKHPVVCITKNDSNTYLAWLSQSTGQKYRLPNNNEWEYIARAGSQFNYWWGDSMEKNQANCAYCGTTWSNNSTSPIESFEANEFGVFDTVGNVWELTSNDEFIARGGAWNSPSKLTQIDSNFTLMPNFRSNYLGFRVLREN